LGSIVFDLKHFLSVTPAHYRVPALMDDFINVVNRNWEQQDPVVLATYVLWRLNNIHPFINGNGRTARAASYFVLCLKSGGWLPGQTILPELIRRERDEYCNHLQHAHDTFAASPTGTPDLGPLHQLVTRLFDEQLATVPQPVPAHPPADQSNVPVGSREPASRAQKAGVVQLRYTIKKQADGRFCIWDNDADQLAQIAGQSLVDLDYDRAFSEMDRLN
jgi:hypothetical protein